MLVDRKPPCNATLTLLLLTSHHCRLVLSINYISRRSVRRRIFYGGPVQTVKTILSTETVSKSPNKTKIAKSEQFLCIWFVSSQNDVPWKLVSEFPNLTFSRFCSTKQTDGLDLAGWKIIVRSVSATAATLC